MVSNKCGVSRKAASYRESPPRINRKFGFGPLGGLATAFGRLDGPGDTVTGGGERAMGISGGQPDAFGTGHEPQFRAKRRVVGEFRPPLAKVDLGFVDLQPANVYTV